MKKKPRTKDAATVAVVSLADLSPLSDNPRLHDGRNLDFITSSLQAVGAARSGVVDEAGTVLLASRSRGPGQVGRQSE